MADTFINSPELIESYNIAKTAISQNIAKFTFIELRDYLNNGKDTNPKLTIVDADTLMINNEFTVFLRTYKDTEHWQKEVFEWIITDLGNLKTIKTWLQHLIALGLMTSELSIDLLYFFARQNQKTLFPTPPVLYEVQNLLKAFLYNQLETQEQQTKTLDESWKDAILGIEELLIIPQNKDRIIANEDTF